MPLFNGAHVHPTLLSAHFNFLMLFTSFHFSPMNLRFFMSMTECGGSAVPKLRYAYH